MSERYSAKNLDEVADFFDTLGSDQLAMNARRYGSKREQRDREVEARIWKQAADMLRKTDINP